MFTLIILSGMAVVWCYGSGDGGGGGAIPFPYALLQREWERALMFSKYHDLSVGNKLHL